MKTLVTVLAALEKNDAGLKPETIAAGRAYLHAKLAYTINEEKREKRLEKLEK